MNKLLSYVVLLMLALVLVYANEIKEDGNVDVAQPETDEVTRIKRQLVAQVSGTILNKKSGKKQKKSKHNFKMCPTVDFKKLQTCCSTPTGSFWAKSSITQCLGKKPDNILLKWCEQLTFNKIITANGHYSYVEPKMRKYVYPAAVAVNCLMLKTGVLTSDGLVDYEAFKAHLQKKLPPVWSTNIAVIVYSCIPVVESLAVKSIAMNATDEPTTLHGLILVQCMFRKIPNHCAGGSPRVSDNCKKLSQIIEKCDKGGGMVATSVEGPLKISTQSVAFTGDPNNNKNDQM